MDHKSQLSVLILFGVIIVAFLLFLNRGSISGQSILEKLKKVAGKKSVSGEYKHGNRDDDGGSGGTTVTFEETPRLVLEQLDMKTGEVIHRYPILTFQDKHKYGDYSDVPDLREARGYYVSRPNAKYGDIFLDNRCKEAYSVSEEHLFIGEENGIIYVRDNESKFGTFNNRTRQRIEGTDIENGMILILGRQAVRFVIPKNPTMEWFDEAKFTQVDDNNPGYEKKKAPRIMRRIVK